MNSTRFVTQLSPQTLAETLGGHLLHPGKHNTIGPIKTSLFNFEPGSTFLAIDDNMREGHSLLGRTLREGAVGLVVKKGASLPIHLGDAFVIEVEDTSKALTQLALSILAAARNNGLSLLAIAGSNGKSSTARIICALLSPTPLLENIEHAPDPVGVYERLLDLTPNHQLAIIELHSTQPGTIRRLCENLQPEAKVLTSISRKRLDRFGDIDGVFNEMKALMETPGGEVFALEHILLHHFPKLKDKPGLCTVGRLSDANVRFNYPVTLGGAIMTRTTAGALHKSYLRLPLEGLHNAHNFALALAAIQSFSTPIETLSSALRNLIPPPLHYRRYRYPKKFPHNGAMIFHDPYPGNPANVRAALDTFRAQSTAKHRVIVLAEMYFLGDKAKHWHQKIAAAAVTLQPHFMIFLGQRWADTMFDAAMKAGIPFGNLRSMTHNDPKTIAANIALRLGRKDKVLIKADPSFQVSQILEALKAQLVE